MSNNVVICLMGPTASGKTSLAVDLVQSGGFEIINVDSAQIYQTMNIGTAKPDKTTLQKAPHRLLDFIDPSQSYSVAQFCNDAAQEIIEIQNNGNTPLLVGGTMMYFNALQQGLAKLPSSQPKIRAELTKILNTKGTKFLHQKLMKIDKTSAEKIHENDSQRILRALEVHQISGQSISELQQTSRQRHPFNYQNFAIIPDDRQKLHQLIADRFDKMLADGFVDEVRILFNRPDLSANLPAIRCVGYRQVWSYLKGEIDYDEMRMQSIIATRQLAKRQITWLRSWTNLTLIKTKSDILKNGDYMPKSEK